MNNQSTPERVADDMVVSLDYTLTVEGEVIDTSRDSEPIEFIQGHGQIIQGLERALYGLELGESRELTVSAKDGYGEFNPEAVVDVPRDEFPGNFPLRPGVELQVRDEEDQVLMGRIVSVGRTDVKLDFNHPLAGKDLQFDVTVVGLREATEDEIAHGHVHAGDEEFDDDYDDDDDFDDDLDEEFDEEDFDDDLEEEFDYDFDEDDFDFDDDDADDENDDDGRA